ncbi:MAG TPA: hypothetical protein DIC42_03370 [Holosporales bacterium]|nr:hypothetical protein [Holosporales bacterium]
MTLQISDIIYDIGYHYNKKQKYCARAISNELLVGMYKLNPNFGLAFKRQEERARYDKKKLI